MPLRLAILVATTLPLGVTGCTNSIDRMESRLSRVRMGHDGPKDVLRQWIKALRNDTVQPEAVSVATTSIYRAYHDPERQTRASRLQGLLVQEAFAGRAMLRQAGEQLGTPAEAALAMPVLTDDELDGAEARLEAAARRGIVGEDWWAAFDLAAEQAGSHALLFSPLHRKVTVRKFNRRWFVEPIASFPDADFGEGGDAAERLHQLQRAGLVQYRLANGDIASLDQLNRELATIFGPGEDTTK